MTDTEYSDEEFRIVPEQKIRKQRTAKDLKKYLLFEADYILSEYYQNEYDRLGSDYVNLREIMRMTADIMGENEKVAGYSRKEIRVMSERLYAFGPYIIKRSPEYVCRMIEDKEPGTAAIILYGMIMALIHERIGRYGGIDSSLFSLHTDGIIDIEDLGTLLSLRDTYWNALFPRWEGTVEKERILAVYEKVYYSLNDVRGLSE